MKKWFGSSGKKVALIMIIVIGVVVSQVMPMTTSAMTTRQTAVDWVRAQANSETKYDVDGIYGLQCSDFATAYINYLIDGNPWSGRYTTYNGYQYYDISYPSGWIKIANSASFVPQAGDILVFSGTSLNPNGHVSVAIEGCTTTVYKAVGQSGSENWRGAHYQSGAYFDSYNSFRGVIRPLFNILTPPTSPSITISKTSITTGENVTFTVGATNATGYTLGIDKGSVRFDTPNIGGNSTYTRSFSEPGSYSAYVSAGNSAGYVDSARVYFTVISPDTVLPTGSWKLPANGSTLKSSGSTTLSVNAADNINMSKVTFHAYYNNAWHDIGQDAHGGNGTYSLTWKYNIFPQSILIHAHLYDAAGNYKNIAGPTVSLVLGTPTGLAATSGGYSSINLKWAASPGASGYRIYRATSSTGTYTFVKEVAGTSYSNTGLTIGKSYYYKVRAYVASGTAKKYSDYTIVVTTKPALSKPASFKVTSSGYDRANLSWATVSGATGYRIYKSTTLDGTYSYVKSITGTSSTITGLTSGKNYYFKVRAYRTAGSTTWFSSYTSRLGVTPIPPTPAAFKISATGYNSIGTSWSAVTGASGYVVYQATSAGGTYSAIATLVGSTYSKTGLTAGNTYYYKVRAFRTVGTTKVYGNYSGVVSAFPSYSITSRNYNVVSRTAANCYLNGYSEAATGFQWKVVTCPADGSSEQTFTFIRQPDGSYKINVLRYNKLLTLEGTVAAGTKLISSIDSGSTAQRFVITRKDGEYYTISPLGRPDLVLSSTTIRTYTNTEHYLTQIETFNGGANQYWQML